MYFRDEAKLDVRGGNGGDGIISFHREKYRPKGGPDGGDGGDGGSVIFVADENINTLYELHRTHKIFAPEGQRGGGNNRSGRKGRNILVHVPVGTIVRDAETQTLLKDFTHHGEKLIVAQGGKGGKGNQHFATAAAQTPRTCTPGTPGERRKLDLELKLIADVGLVGFPNAGKSTLLSRISAATPKIANYPFTTLLPQLGIVSLSATRTMVVADLPGLIEGASQGAGLGDQFLRHVERTRLILHIIDCSDAEPDELARRVKAITGELVAFSDSLANTPQILVGNKLDVGGEAGDHFRAMVALLQADPAAPKFLEVFGISGASGEGIPEMLEATYARLIEIKRPEHEAALAAGTDETLAPEPDGVPREKLRVKGIQKIPPHKKFADEMFAPPEPDADDE